MSDPKVTNMETTSSLPATQSDVAVMPALEVSMEKVEITAQQIRQYVAPPDATTADIAFFMAMSRSLGLNPFAGDIYLIPFKGKGGRKYAGVVNYTVLLDRADASRVLDGIEIEMDDEEHPTKCTVTVHRKDWKIPFKRTTLMSESMKMYGDKPMALWGTRPRQMLEKCAVTAALRMAIPACRRMPYIGEELIADPSQYQEPQVILSEAVVTGAVVEPDIDYLRGQYFKKFKQVFGDLPDDARHEWQSISMGKASVKDWDADNYNDAIDFLDAKIEQQEEERLQSELGGDAALDEVNLDGEDGAGEPSTPEDGVEPAMESADAIQKQRDAKLERIKELLPPAFKSYEETGFATWAWNQLDDECRDVPVADLSDLDLDIIIGAMEAREDTEADNAAGENGLF